MDIRELTARAVKIKNLYHELEQKKYGKTWTVNHIAQGFVGDVGDVMKLLIAKEGLRDVEGIDQKLEHELADCLYSVLVLASKLDVDIEKAFVQTMDELELRIQEGRA